MIKMNQKSYYSKLILIILFTALIAFQGFLFHRFVDNLQETRRWLLHSYEVVNKIQELSGSIDHNRIDTIHFFITGNKVALERKLENITEQLKNLKAITHDNHEQQKKLTQIEAILADYFTQMQTFTHQLRNQPESISFIKEIYQQALNSKELELTTTLQAMKKEENRLLENRLIAANKARTNFYRFNFAGAIFSYLLILGFVFMLLVSIRKLKQSEKERLAANIQFKKLFDISSDPHLLFNEEGIIECNSAVLKVLKCYEKSQVIGLHLHELTAEYQTGGKAHTFNKEEFEQLVKTEGVVNMEWTLTRFDGIDIPIQMTITPIVLNKKEVFLAIWHDISEQKKYQNMLEQLHNINTNKTIPLRTKITQIIKLGSQYFYLPNGFVGKIDDDYFQVLYTTDNEHSILPGIKVKVDDHINRFFKLRYLLALEKVSDSEQIYFSDYLIKSYIGCPIYVNGRQYGTISYFKGKPRDIPFSETEKTFIHLISQWIGSEIETNLALNQLKENKERLERAIKSANDGLWEWNCITNKVYVNPRYKQILGYDENELDDNLESFANLIHPEDSAYVWDAVHKTFENNTPFNVDFRFIKKDGSNIWVKSRGDVIRDKTGKPVLMSGFITDIDNIKKRTNADVSNG